MPKGQLYDEGGSEKFTNVFKKRRKVFFEVIKEEGLGEYAAETVKMFDSEGVQVGKLTYANKADAIQVTHFHIDIWEEKQEFPQRFIKWF